MSDRQAEINKLAWELAEEDWTRREYQTYQPFKGRDKVVPIRGDSAPRPHPDAPLRTYCAAELAGKPVPSRQWLVDGVIPHRNVALLSGDGGIGKTLLLLNLFAHIAARLDWLGFNNAA
jgi:hypothetical protein